MLHLILETAVLFDDGCGLVAVMYVGPLSGDFSCISERTDLSELVVRRPHPSIRKLRIGHLPDSSLQEFRGLAITLHFYLLGN